MVESLKPVIWARKDNGTPRLKPVGLPYLKTCLCLTLFLSRSFSLALSSSLPLPVASVSPTLFVFAHIYRVTFLATYISRLVIYVLTVICISPSCLKMSSCTGSPFPSSTATSTSCLPSHQTNAQLHERNGLNMALPYMHTYNRCR